MIPSRQPEITIKFTETPRIATEGKQTTLAFNSENGLLIKATVTRKTAAKQLKKAEGFADWIGAVAGKIDRIEDGVIHVSGGALQIFEKKPKPPKENVPLPDNINELQAPAKH